MGAAAPIIGLALGVAGTVGQVVSARKAADEQKEIQERQGAAAAQRRIEERRRAFRQRRIAAARIEQGAENTGVTGSSVTQGAIGSLGTQLAATRAGIDLNETVERGNARSATALSGIQRDASIFSGLTSLGGSIFSLGGSGSSSTTQINIPDETK